MTRKAVLTGFLLPAIVLCCSLSLVLLSFIHIKLSAALAIDKLILLTAAASPVIYISGAVISIAALFKSKAKTTALIAALLNIALLIVLLYFSKPLLMEFEFVI